VCTCVSKQRSCGVIIARLRSSVRSLLHQHQDLHQSTYLYLSEDREPTSHQVVSDFRLPVRYYRVLYFSFFPLYQVPLKKPKKVYTFCWPIALRAAIFIFSVALLSSCSSWLTLVAGFDSCFWFVVLCSMYSVVPLT
jgi:hypothetical protein